MKKQIPYLILVLAFSLSAGCSSPTVTIYKIYDTIHIIIYDTIKHPDLNPIAKTTWQIPPNWQLLKSPNGDYVLHSSTDGFDMYISKNPNGGITHEADQIFRSKNKSDVLILAKKYFDQIDFKPTK